MRLFQFDLDRQAVFIQRRADVEDMEYRSDHDENNRVCEISTGTDSVKSRYQQSTFYAECGTYRLPNPNA